MRHIQRKSAIAPEILSRDLLILHDRLTEFADRCAFLCDAFAAIALQEEAIDPATARGMGLSAHWIKDKVQEIKQDLKKTHEQARAAIR